jgi:hypothetical protein
MDKEIDDRSNHICIQCALKTGKRCGMAFGRANLIWYLRSEVVFSRIAQVGNIIFNIYCLFIRRYSILRHVDTIEMS